MKRSIPFHELEIELLRDPDCAREYLQIALEQTRSDGNRVAFLRALQNVVDARAGIETISRQTSKPANTLKETILKEGNPCLDRLEMILNEIGLQLSIDVKHSL